MFLHFQSGQILQKKFGEKTYISYTTRRKAQ